MIINKIIALGIAITFICINNISAQNIDRILSGGEVHGNFGLDMQYYQEDSLIGAQDVPEKTLMNAFANFNYTNGNFSAGFRYESYLTLS